MADLLQQVRLTIPFEPYVYQRMKMIEGLRVVVDTVRGAVSGRLVDVQPDHLAIMDVSGRALFFVRIPEIIWVMPDFD